MRIAAPLCALLVLAAPAVAQTMTGAEAKKQVYPADQAEVALVRDTGLSDEQARLLLGVGAQQLYYGAIAISPDEGLMAEATVAATNHHSVEAAARAAVAECDAKKTGAAPCKVVAVIRPKGWEARPLMLSADASRGLAGEYGGKGAALAVSATTGAWGMGKGAEAAVAACAAKPVKPADCVVLIAD